MSKLVPVSHRELIRRLRKLGFEGLYHGTKHPYMAKGDLLVTIPNPHGGTIGVKLLVIILREAEID
ncbi:MAG TPA: type II toxin-antitoxin system HicA family toxin [Methanothrix sp.]|nr:type II toxin-antitoxin system HicA family toxin [Methanothrix sp.]